MACDSSLMCDAGELLKRKSIPATTDECCARCGLPASVCNTFSDATSCGNKCEWHIDTFTCQEIGWDIPCLYIFDSAACMSQGCHWNTSLSQCHDKEGGLPCHLLSDHEACNTHNCKWDEDARSCVKKGAKIECIMPFLTTTPRF